MTMVLAADVFLDLCDLYPETEKTLKWRALDRRHYFLKHMQEQEREYAIGRNKKGIRELKEGKKGRKEFKIPRLDDEFQLTFDVEDYSKIQLFREEYDQAKESKHELETLKEVALAKK